MKTRAAVMWEGSGPYEVCEIDLDPPKQDEVLVRYDHAGLCHTDEHLRSGDIATLAKEAEKHYGCPQDIEWAVDADLHEGENVVLLQ